MKKEQYKQILQFNVIPSIIQLTSNGFIFQSDNDPNHDSITMQGYLENKERKEILYDHFRTWISTQLDFYENGLTKVFGFAVPLRKKIYGGF